MNGHNHEHLAGEKPGSHTYQTILMVIFFVVWIVDSVLLRVTTLSLGTFSVSLDIMFLYGTYSISVNAIPAIVILVVALYFINASHLDLFDTENGGLVTRGVFSRVRNPMYLGIVLFYLWLMILTLSLASLVVWLVICDYYNMLANYEEIKLEEKFGDEYIEYKKSVRKWIPV